ncbi:MAG: hypothetical protein ABIH79_01955 [archaeon]
MVISKRAQIFLLAAVIISSIIISLGITANQARINQEPKNFYDFSYEVQREIGAVMDYEIYTNFSDEEDLEEFVDILAANIQDNDPNSTFMFIYGDNTGMTLKSYNSKKPKGTNTISIGTFYENIDQQSKDNGSKETLDEEDLEGINDIVVEFEDNEVSFPVSKFRQVIFLIQKDVGDERFVTSK